MRFGFLFHVSLCRTHVKAGSRLLRFLLGEAAHSAIKGDPELKRFYCRLVHRRGPQKATIAVARKLLIRAYIILRDEIDYGEFLRRGVAAGPARVQHRPNGSVAKTRDVAW